MTSRSSNPLTTKASIVWFLSPHGGVLLHAAEEDAQIALCGERRADGGPRSGNRPAPRDGDPVCNLCRSYLKDRGMHARIRALP